MPHDTWDRWLVDAYALLGRFGTLIRRPCGMSGLRVHWGPVRTKGMGTPMAMAEGTIFDNEIDCED